MGSIGARLRREREQRVEYERWRTVTDPMRNWSFTFGKLPSPLEVIRGGVAN